MITAKCSQGTFTDSILPTKVIENISSYNHQINIIGGYVSANISFLVSPIESEEWISEGIGRHIEISSIYGNTVWEGIVNSVKLNIGERSLTIGNYIDIINKIKVAYTLRNPPLGTPDADRYLETNWATNVASVQRYGVLEEIISGGSGYSQEMDALRDQSLDDNAEPLISESIPAGGADSRFVSVTLDCIGYYRLFERQLYNYGTTTEYANISIKVGNIVDSNQNKDYFLFRKQIVPVQYNALLHETESRTAWGIIKDDISKTPQGDNGIICGMFADNTFIFAPAPDNVFYRRDGGSSIIKDQSNIEVPASEIVPGGLMENNDLSFPIYYRIKSVNYSLSDDRIQVNQNQRSISEALSKKMLGGMF